MVHEIDMKRLHQGCGESLQSNLPGISRLRRAAPVDGSEGRPRVTGRFRSQQTHRRIESEHR
jgi:hypothetical protein